MPELNTSVFIVDGARVKNKQDRLLVLNQVARSVIDSVRGQDPVHVFVYIPPENTKKKLDIRLNKKLAPIKRMNNSAWKNARERAADKWEAEKGQPAPQGFRRVRVHDLKHTFGRRLRAAGVSYEDRQDLLGHMSSRITTHYSAPELTNLIASAERACADESRKFPSSTLLFRKTG